MTPASLAHRARLPVHGTYLFLRRKSRDLLHHITYVKERAQTQPQRVSSGTMTSVDSAHAPKYSAPGFPVATPMPGAAP